MFGVKGADRKQSYRLGVPGFLPSTELIEAGYLVNNGVRDQQVALRWINKYISGFGGDPDAVAVVGQSSGAGESLLSNRS